MLSSGLNKFMINYSKTLSPKKSMSLPLSSPKSLRLTDLSLEKPSRAFWKKTKLLPRVNIIPNTLVSSRLLTSLPQLLKRKKLLKKLPEKLNKLKLFQINNNIICIAIMQLKLKQIGMNPNFMKYKTLLFKNHYTSKECVYKDKCQFAHGIHELRSNNVSILLYLK